MSDTPAAPEDRPDPAADLVGLPVEEAARRAEQRGWRVRPHRDGDLLTMDHVADRLNLRHDDDGTVRRAWFG